MFVCFLLFLSIFACLFGVASTLVLQTVFDMFVPLVIMFVGFCLAAIILYSIHKFEIADGSCSKEDFQNASNSLVWFACRFCNMLIAIHCAIQVQRVGIFLDKRAFDGGHFYQQRH